MPNTMDSFRFSTQQKQRVNELLANPQAFQWNLGQQVPEAPPEWEQDIIDERAKTFTNEKTKLLPWMEQIIRNRDTFHGLGLAVATEDEGGMPMSIFVITLCTQRPYSLMGFRAKIAPRHWPAVGEAAEHRLAQELGHHFYALEETACINASDFLFGEPENVVVLEGVIHVSVGVLVCGGTEPLLDFRCMHDRATAKGEKGERKKEKAQKPKVTEAVLHLLLEEYPWLTAADVELVLSHSKKKHGPRKPGEPLIAPMPEPDDDVVEAAYMDVASELAERRESWRLSDDVEPAEHFYTQVRGGAWTMRATGEAADSFMVKCRSHAKEFCLLFLLPQQKSFAFNKYGEAECVELGREWCRLLN